MKKQSGEFKLVVSDLDGTIFDKTYKLTSELRSTVKRIRELGCEFTFATGRLYPSAIQFAAELGLRVPLITYNGALIRNPVNNETVVETPVSQEKVREIIRLTDDKPVMRFVFIDDVVYTDIEDSITQQYAKALKVKFKRVDCLECVITKDPTMMALRAEPEEIVKLTRQIKKFFGNDLYTANSRPFFLDIAHPKVSKGFALKCLCDKLGIYPSQTIAIGDERNDLEMMQLAGIGAAVGNAQPTVKEAADYVADGKYWQGVIEVINKFVLKVP